jgi:predicted nucleic acid-binding protein
MRFWDASAVVPLLIAQPSTEWAQTTAEEDPSMLVWWGTSVECTSALARLERAREIDDRAMQAATERLSILANAWAQVDPSDDLRDTAVRFLRVHPLRAADSLQLSAAFMAAERRPGALALVTLDERLASAARKEGFAVVDREA